MFTLDRTDNEKPRLEGITSIIDKLQPLDIENFKNIVSYVDSVKYLNHVSYYTLLQSLKDESNFTMNIISRLQLIVKLLITHSQIILLMNTFVRYCHLDLTL
jgi:hypothetical protein